MRSDHDLDRLGAEIAQVGGWEFRPETRVLTLSDLACTWHGLAPGTRPLLDDALHSYSPESRPRLLAALETCASTGRPFDDEIDICLAGQPALRMRIAGRAGRDASGRITRIEGALQRVPREREFRQELLLLKRFREFAAAMPHIVWTADPAGRVDFTSRDTANPPAEGRPGLAERWMDHVHPEDMHRVLETWIRAIHKGENYGIEFRIWTHAYQAFRWHLVSATPIRDEAGTIIKWYGSSIDIHDRKQADEEVARLARRLSNTLESITDAFLVLDREWHFTYVNKEGERLLRRSRQELLGQSVWNIFPEALGTEFELQYRRALQDNCSVHFESHYAPLDRWFDVRAYPSEEGLAIYFQDLTKRKLAEHAARDSEERFNIVCKATSDVIWDWDLNTDQLWWNENIESQFGLSRPLLAPDSRSWTDQIHPEDKQRILDSVAIALEGEAENWQDEYRFRRQDNQYAWVLDRGFIIRDALNRPLRMVGSMTDITERTAAQSKIQWLAFYDPLTHLPNRALLQERLQRAFEHSSRSGELGALLFIDLDNFKALNDTFGHDTGDLFLKEIGDRLLECVRKSDTVARLGGDEFVVMLEGLSPDENEAERRALAIARKVVDSFAHPCVLHGHRHYSTASIGVAMFNGRAAKVADLLKRADLAMYQAKGEGRNTIRFFNPQMQERLLERTGLETDLRSALENGSFLLHYQPQFDANQCLIGAEALVRWQHPVRGVVMPGDFICVAEETGQIIPLGNWILHTTCRQLAEWAGSPATAHLTLAVNVSAGQFLQPDFVDQVLQAVRETGARPQCLTLELTESVLVRDVEQVIAKMTRLKSAGIRFSLDDFGTGYSSLSYLRRLPLDQLKIDRSFVMDLPGDPNAEAIVRTIINMGAALNLNVVAEGVEHGEQAEFLRRQGCQGFQGYFFGIPMPLPSFIGMHVQVGLPGRALRPACQAPEAG